MLTRSKTTHGKPFEVLVDKDNTKNSVAMSDDNFSLQDPLPRDSSPQEKINPDSIITSRSDKINERNDDIPQSFDRIETSAKSAIFFSDAKIHEAVSQIVFQVPMVNTRIDDVISEVPIKNINDEITLAQVVDKLNKFQVTVNDLNNERSNLNTEIHRLKRKVRSLENHKSIFNESLTAIEKELSLSLPNMEGGKVSKYWGFLNL